MAASKTWPTFRPRNAAAAEKTAAITRPRTSERPVNSATGLSAGTIGLYVSPGFSAR